MRPDELRNRALSLVNVPDDYTLVMENIESTEALFIWEDASGEEWVSVDLTMSGELLSFTMNRRLEKKDAPEWTTQQKRKKAETFIEKHYPHALSVLTFTRKKEVSSGIQFQYEQVVMDLPLDGSGCSIDVDPCGNVVGFRYEGIQPTPEIPQTLITKAQLKEDVQNRLAFELTIAELYKDFYDVEKDEVRLLYEPNEPYMTYKANCLRPTFAISSDEKEEEEVYQSLPTPSVEKEVDSLKVEEIIGIPSHMEVLREIDLGEEKGIVWRNPDWQAEESELSLEAYFRERNEDTVKAFLSKETGRLKSFMWFNERKGSLDLDRDTCFEKALSFLQLVLPRYDKYLKYVVQDEEEEDDKERFMFWMCTENGISIPSGMVIVVVNRTTGEIDHYSGPNIEIESVQKMPSEPRIAKEEAKRAFLERLDFKLEWKQDLDAEHPEPFLVYVACDVISKRPIRYVDAVTGELVMDKA